MNHYTGSQPGYNRWTFCIYTVSVCRRHPIFLQKHFLICSLARLSAVRFQILALPRRFNFPVSIFMKPALWLSFLSWCTLFFNSLHIISDWYFVGCPRFLDSVSHSTFLESGFIWASVIIWRQWHIGPLSRSGTHFWNMSPLTRRFRPVSELNFSQGLFTIIFWTLSLL